MNGTGIPSCQMGCSTIALVSRCLRVCLASPACLLPPGHPVFSAGSCPGPPSPRGLRSPLVWDPLLPQPTRGQDWGRTWTVCMFLGPHSVDERGTGCSDGVGGSAPRRPHSAVLPWWVPPAWSRALDPRDGDRLVCLTRTLPGCSAPPCPRPLGARVSHGP